MEFLQPGEKKEKKIENGNSHYAVSASKGESSN
jgi:hypothetical protein